MALGTERGEGQRRNPLKDHGFLEVAVSHVRKGLGGKMKFHVSYYLETSKPENQLPSRTASLSCNGLESNL